MRQQPRVFEVTTIGHTLGLVRALGCAAAGLGVCALVGGCSSAPGFELRSAQVVERTAQATVVEVVVVGTNSNADDPLPLRRVRYVVEMGGARFEGERSAEVTLPAGSGSSSAAPSSGLAVEGSPTTRAREFRLAASFAPGVAVGPVRVSGAVEYRSPGVVSDALFDWGVVKPTQSLDLRGETREATK
jgi:hypothetical protein